MKIDATEGLATTHVRRSASVAAGRRHTGMPGASSACASLWGAGSGSAVGWLPLQGDLEASSVGPGAKTRELICVGQGDVVADPTLVVAAPLALKVLRQRH